MPRYFPVLVLLCVFASPALSEQVSDLKARYTYGQTFLTWRCPPGTGWTYRVYRTESPLPPGAGLDSFEPVGEVRDSSGCNLRLSSLIGSLETYRMPTGQQLSPDQGLFVFTPTTTGTATYAVTCQSESSPEETTLAAGTNLLSSGISEWPARPTPYYQREVTREYGSMNVTATVFTLWTSDRNNGFMEAMSNRPSTPYDCAVSVNPGGTTHALMFHPHVRGGNYLQLNFGSTTPGEYVLTMDDYLPSEVKNSFWFGYVSCFDFDESSGVAFTGEVEDYTERRVLFTLQWARHGFPVEKSRVYIMGASMGAIGATRLAMRRPDLVAGVMAVLPLFDMSYQDDPNVEAAFNADGVQRWACDRLFGPVESALPMPDGSTAFDQLNANLLVRNPDLLYVSPIIAFNGRYDTTVGWGEKPAFYATMQQQRAGGCFFFDNRTHSGSETAEWVTVERFDYLYRFRTNLSFPAFSRCSADDDPGLGAATDGDSVGTINGYMDWEPELDDMPHLWSVILKLRDLEGRTRMHLAPSSVVVDVTPRRVQSFMVPPRTFVEYQARSRSDGTVLASGSVISDDDGIVTIPQVPVDRFGTRLTIYRNMTTAVGPESGSSLQISGLPNPLGSRQEFSVSWSGTGHGRVALLDVTGRRVRDLWQGEVGSAPTRITLDPHALAPGMYFVEASRGGDRLVRRVAVFGP